MNTNNLEKDTTNYLITTVELKEVYAPSHSDSEIKKLFTSMMPENEGVSVFHTETSIDVYTHVKTFNANDLENLLCLGFEFQSVKSTPQVEKIDSNEFKTTSILTIKFRFNPIS